MRTFSHGTTSLSREMQRSSFCGRRNKNVAIKKWTLPPYDSGRYRCYPLTTINSQRRALILNSRVVLSVKLLGTSHDKGKKKLAANYYSLFLATLHNSRVGHSLILFILLRNYYMRILSSESGRRGILFYNVYKMSHFLWYTEKKTTLL